MNKQDLLDLKDEIDSAKSEVNKLEGRQEHLMQQLADDWKCKSLDQAKKKLKVMQKKLKKLNKQITDETTQLQEKYEL